MPKRRPNGMVFVSYAHADRQRVEPLVNFLATLFNVYWDQHIGPGENWRRQLMDRLDSARCVIVVWTLTSVESNFIWSEVQRVKERGVVVPVRLDRDALIPLDFDNMQHLDLTSWKGGTTKEIELLIQWVSNLVARRRRDRRALASLENNDSFVSQSISVTGQLRGLSEEIRTISGVLIAGNGPVKDLLGTLKEVHRTYSAVSAAIKRFIAPVIRGKIDIKPYLEMERGALVRMIKNNRGHCTRILEYYFRVDGLRDWLEPRLGAAQPEQLKKVDEAFAKLSTADGDLFSALDYVGDVLTEEASAIVGLILSGQQLVARQRIIDGRTKLLPLERQLSSAMDELQQIESSLGYVPAGSKRKRRKRNR
jgi:hypothetical protein